MVETTRKLTDDMAAAQGREIDCEVGSEAAAERIAAFLGIDAENAVKALQVARDAQNLRADSAFGTRFCEVADWRNLDFQAACAYIHEHYDGFYSPPQVEAIAVAVAAEGMDGMGGEEAIIGEIPWLHDAGTAAEDDKYDAVTDDGVKVQIKRNDRSQKRIDAASWDIPDDAVLLSWAVTDGGLRIGFEASPDDTPSHSIARGTPTGRKEWADGE